MIVEKISFYNNLPNYTIRQEGKYTWLEIDDRLILTTNLERLLEKLNKERK